MINFIIRLLYKRFPVKISEVLCEEFLRDIPKEVSEPAITLLAEERVVIEKWLTYQAFLVQRRAMGDFRRADFYLGILTNIKILLKIFERRSRNGIQTKDSGEPQTIPDYKKELEDSLKGVEKFKKGGVDK